MDFAEDRLMADRKLGRILALALCVPLYVALAGFLVFVTPIFEKSFHDRRIEVPWPAALVFATADFTRGGFLFNVFVVPALPFLISALGALLWIRSPDRAAHRYLIYGGAALASAVCVFVVAAVAVP